MVPSSSDIPDIRKDILVETFLICRIGKNVPYQNGVSPGGRLYYDMFFQNSDEDIIKRILILLSEGNINIYGEIQCSNLLEVLKLIPKSMIGAQYIEILEALIIFLDDGNEAINFFNTKEFKQFKRNFLS